MRSVILVFLVLVASISANAFTDRLDSNASNNLAFKQDCKETCSQVRAGQAACLLSCQSKEPSISFSLFYCFASVALLSWIVRDYLQTAREKSEYLLLN